MLLLVTNSHWWKSDRSDSSVPVSTIEGMRGVSTYRLWEKWCGTVSETRQPQSELTDNGGYTSFTETDRSIQKEVLYICTKYGLFLNMLLYCMVSHLN